MRRARNGVLPENLQKLCVSHDEDHRKKYNFKSQIRNSLDKDLKCCSNTFSMFKIYKEKIMNRYV